MDAAKGTAACADNEASWLIYFDLGNRRLGLDSNLLGSSAVFGGKRLETHHTLDSIVNVTNGKFQN